jgi:hypothetical protein
MSAIAIPIVLLSISTKPTEPENWLLMEDKGMFESVDGRLVNKNLASLLF